MKKFSLVLLLISTIAIFGFSTVKNPDTIIDATIGEPDTLDPHFAYDTASGEVIFNVYECLIQYKGESIQEFEPRLATAVPSVENGLIKEGGKVYVFPIRKGIKFHNGADLTPEDVEYSFERGIIFDPSGGPMWMIIEALFGVYTWEDVVTGYIKEKTGKEVKYSDLFDENGEPLPEYKDLLVGVYKDVLDPAIEVEGDSVVFRLKRPFGPFLHILAQGASWSSVLDKETCIEKGLWDGKADTWWRYHDWEKERSPLYAWENGTGPFKLVEWDRTEQKVILERFDDYWRGPAKIKKVIIWGIDEFSTRKAMLEKGDVDICAVPTQYISQVEGLPGVTVIKGLPRPVVTSLHFNWTVAEGSEYIGSGKLDGNGIPRDFFSDINVRKAFVHAFNYDAFIEDVLQGLGNRVPADLPEGFLGYNPNLPLYKFDLRIAKQALKAAWGGKVWEKGFKMTLLYNTGNEMRQVAAEMLKYYIESLNPKFKIEVQGVQWPNYLSAYKKGLLPAFIIGWLADYPDPHNFIFTYYHSKGVYGGRQGEAYREWAKKNVDELIEKAVQEVDPAKRQKLYEEVQRIAIENYVGMPLYQPQAVRVHRSWLKGWYNNPMRPGDDYYAYWKEE
ncbi:MAG: ABC transporter substrate-binding protein [Thermotoga sp.]|nr:MAG: ABC transporter substrate-binding protein [Thermotoga sp.]